MPYFYGTLGILYNTTMVSDEEVSTWNVLWDEAYKDSIIMQNSVRDSFTPALRLSGYDINTTDENQLNDALDLPGHCRKGHHLIPWRKQLPRNKQEPSPHFPLPFHLQSHRHNRHRRAVSAGRH